MEIAKGKTDVFVTFQFKRKKNVTALQQAFTENFGQLNQTEFQQLLPYFEVEQIKKNDFFTEENKYCRKLSLQQSGLLRVYKIWDDKEITQWIATPNYFITEISSFFFDEPGRWNIQALTDVELLTISKENYRKICTEFPKWNDIEKKFIAKCFAMLENRVFSHLSLTAEERYDLFFNQNKELFNQVPLQYLASVLGMTAETFSRIRKRKAATS